MCRLLEEMRKEVAVEAEVKGKAEATIELALKMLARGRDSIEEIAEITGLSVEEVYELAKREIT